MTSAGSVWTETEPLGAVEVTSTSPAELVSTLNCPLEMVVLVGIIDGEIPVLKTPVLSDPNRTTPVPKTPELKAPVPTAPVPTAPVPIAPVPTAPVLKREPEAKPDGAANAFAEEFV